MLITVILVQMCLLGKLRQLAITGFLSNLFIYSSKTTVIGYNFLVCLFLVSPKYRLQKRSFADRHLLKTR